MKNKFFLIALVVTGLFIAAFVFFKEGFQKDSTSSQVAAQTAAQTSLQNTQSFRVAPFDQSLLIKPHSPVKGEFSAKVTVVEFLDPECEACAAMNPIVKRIFEEYKSDIKLVVRYMSYHGNSMYVANILEGARNENKYWEALDILFETQSLWANHQNPNPDLIPDLLKPLKLNMTKIIADAKAGKYNQQVQEDMEDGKKAGVMGTPTFFVNGSQLQELGYEPLRNAIEAQLNKK
jgi:protein-disulfide isomerase